MSLSNLALLALALPALATPTSRATKHPVERIELGPRPYWLVNNMDEGPLKDKLASCSENHQRRTRLTIGHRGGGTLEIPEETKESIMAGTRMGAGVQECDVVFTQDKQLVCRHDQCDLHTTTNIVNTPLNSKCTTPFQPAASGKPATAKCCTSDITLAEFKTLCGKMDASNVNATTAADFLKGTPPYRTDLYANACGTVLTHKEYIALVDYYGLDFTPELKVPQVNMPFLGSDYTLEKFSQQMIDEYKAAGIKPSRVWPQSFLYDVVKYYLKNEPDFGKQTIFLDESGDTDATYVQAVANLTQYAQAGVKIMAPPLYYLVTVQNGKIVPSTYAITAKKLGLRLITWTLERSGWLGDGSHGGYYYTSIANITNNDGDVYNLLDVLVRDVGVFGVFSDWSATVTYYANCFGYVY